MVFFFHPWWWNFHLSYLLIFWRRELLLIVCVLKRYRKIKGKWQNIWLLMQMHYSYVCMCMYVWVCVCVWYCLWVCLFETNSLLVSSFFLLLRFYIHVPAHFLMNLLIHMLKSDTVFHCCNQILLSAFCNPCSHFEATRSLRSLTTSGFALRTHISVALLLILLWRYMYTGFLI